MTSKKLTKAACDSATPKNKDWTLWDTELKGFGLKITPAGKKIFLHKYRNAQQKQRKPSIGTFGEITPAQAREIVLQQKALLAIGEDPADSKDKAKTEITLNEYADLYFANSGKKASTIRDERLRYNAHLRGTLGKNLLRKITRDEIIRWHRHDVKSETSANRTLATLSSMFSEAELDGYRDFNTNYCKGIKKYPENERTRHLSAEEIERFLRSSDKLTQSGMINPMASSIFKLLLLTGARKSEIWSLKWDYIDFEKKVIKQPSSKTGAKIIQLSDAAISIILDQPKIASHDEVFPGNGADGFYKGLRKPFEKIKADANLSDLHIHDLRHTFASQALSMGIDSMVLKNIVGWKDMKSMQRYAKNTEKSLIENNQRISDRILG